MATITVAIDDQLEEVLEEQSKLAGKQLDAYVIGLITQGAQHDVASRMRPPRKGQSMLELLESMDPPGAFKTSKEVDDYLGAERDSWDRSYSRRAEPYATSTLRASSVQLSDIQIIGRF